jgi:hypothetical protein
MPDWQRLPVQSFEVHLTGAYQSLPDQFEITLTVRLTGHPCHLEQTHITPATDIGTTGEL